MDKQPHSFIYIYDQWKIKTQKQQGMIMNSDQTAWFNPCWREGPFQLQNLYKFIPPQHIYHEDMHELLLTYSREK